MFFLLINQGLFKMRNLMLVMGLLIGGASTVRGDVIIDFESLSGMNNSAGSSVPSASQLSNQLLTTDGVVFRSGSPFVAVVNLGAGHATSGNNGIGGVSMSGKLDYSVSITAEFFLPNDPSIAAVTDFVSIGTDMRGDGGSIVLQAFDVDGTLLATDTKVDVGGAFLLVSAAGIHSVQFFNSTASVAFDDFSFGTLRPAPQAVPEPGGLAMMSLGTLGLVGYGLKRCKD